MFHRNLLLFYFGIFFTLSLYNCSHIIIGTTDSLANRLGLSQDVSIFWILLSSFLFIVLLGFGSFLFLLICSLILNVKTGKPPVKNLNIIYKFGISDSLTRSSVCEIYELFPFTDHVQICYERNCRTFGIAHGAALTGQLDDETKTLSATNGYKTFQAKAVANAVYISCPTLPWFSYFGVWLILKIIYPKLYQYSKKHRLSAYPVVEIYKRYSVLLMAPLSQQDNFVVPEAENFVVRSCSKLEESPSSVVSTTCVKRSTSRAKSTSVGVLEQTAVNESLDIMDLESRYRLEYTDVVNNNILKSESLKHSTPIVGNGYTKQG